MTLHDEAAAQRRRLRRRRGSSAKGEDHPHAKLTDDDVRLIRELYAHGLELREQAKGLTLRAIAEKFDVRERAIWGVVTGETWGHVE